MTSSRDKITALTRRDFLKIVLGGAAATAFSGCLTAVQEDVRRVGDTRRTHRQASIPLRTLGRTGIQVSLLGYGSHIAEEVMNRGAERERQVECALENGINLFDIYEQPGRQYERMGVVLRPVRKRVVISVYLGGKSQDGVPGSLRWLDESLKKFQTDYVDLIRVLGAGEKNPVTEARYEAVQRARELGKVRAVGLAAHNEKDLLFELRRHPYDFAMFVYNFHQGPEEYPEFLRLAKERGMGLIAMKPLACGSIIKLADRLRAEGRIEGLREISVPAAALRYIFQNPEIASAIPAMMSMDEVKENLQAGFQPHLSPRELEVLKQLSAAAGPFCRFPDFKPRPPTTVGGAD